MKNIALLIATLFLTTAGFAGTASLSKSQRAINNAWKANNTSGVSLSHDINMVYGGQDVSPHHDVVLSNIAV